ncbi:uncharacterized protein LOC114930282 [Nylanderia fulva]|uniref:uncharacterized protein LOC114930282 n=1 Tax=Nylanderia fulva TaxID=613905 RepID=UPI0010FB531A|nr:uncharacterized protein LOC114930282 [Nylanderia fulva]
MAQQHFLPDDQIEKILTEARFKFALKCLKTVMCLKKNVVFSPYSIYDGLLLIYLASHDDIALQLRPKLELPDYIHQQNISLGWILDSKTKKRREYENIKVPNYYDENSYWMTYTDSKSNMTQYLFKKNLRIVNSDQTFIHTIMKRINQLLKRTTQGCIRNSVKLNNITEKMDIIQATVLCLKGNTIQQNIFTDESEIPRTVLSPKLSTLVTEIPLPEIKQSLIVLFPVQSTQHIKIWKINKNVTELIDRLTTESGMDEFRKVLNNEQSSQKRLLTGEVFYPNFFELENEFSIDQLLDELDIRILLEPDKASLPTFSDQNLHLGGAKHRASIKVTRENVTACSVNMFFTKGEMSFNQTADINHSF